MEIQITQPIGLAPYRSWLEQQVAEELTARGVTFAYEAPVAWPPDVVRLAYLPDFTIQEAPAGLQLPPWLECKPQSMLYDLRDVIGVTRRAGEHFSEDVTVTGVDATMLHSHPSIAELAKPKLLAERLERAVLVVGTVRAHEKLSVLLTSSALVFSRCHPFVNWRRLELKRERARQQAERDAERARARAAAEEAARARREEWREWIRTMAPGLDAITPRFASPCKACGAVGADGMVYRDDAQEQWIHICDRCLAGG